MFKPVGSVFSRLFPDLALVQLEIWLVIITLPASGKMISDSGFNNPVQMNANVDILIIVLKNSV